MRVANVSTYDRGGAGLAAYRLHRGLLRYGVQSTMFVKDKGIEDDSIIPVHPSAGFQGVLERLSRLPVELQRRQVRMAFKKKSVRTRFEIFTDDRGDATDLLEQLDSYDIIALHWISRLVDFQQFFPVAARKPIVWKLDDMNAFTGGCHYDSGCGRFMQQCGSCPALSSRIDHDLSAQVFQRKQAVYEKIPLEQMVVVSPSRWLAGEVSRAPLMSRFRVEVIPNSLDTEQFKPMSKVSAREKLGLPADRQIVLVPADYLSNPRKDAASAIAAVTSMPAETRPFLLTLGRWSYGREELQIPHKEQGSSEILKLL